MPANRSRGRGQTETLGLALLFALTIVGASVVVAFGATALDDSRASATMEGAEQSMTQLDSRASLVALGSARSQSVTLPETSGETFVEESAGDMTIRVTNQASGTTNSTTVTLGRVVHRRDETTIAYQGGGVWKRTRGGQSMVSPPEFHYRATGENPPTLTLPLVTVRGDGGGGEVRLSQGATTRGVIPNASGPIPSTNPMKDMKVEIVVRSEFYRAWGRFFEQRTSGDVVYDDPNEEVTIELVAPADTGTVSAPVLSGAATLGLSNAGNIDSYDSDAGPYASGVNDRATVVVDGAFNPSNAYTIRGGVRASDGASISNSITIERETVIGGDSTVSNSPTFDGRYSTGGDLTSSNSPTYGDGLVVGGDADMFRGTVDGDLHVGEDADLQRTDVNGDVYTGGDLTLRQNTPIAGTLYVDGDLIMESNADHTGDVYVTGDVVLNYNAEITGDVRAGGEIAMSGWQSSIDGSAWAAGDSDGDGYGIEMSGASEVTGNATASAEIDADDSGEDGTVGDTVSENDPSVSTPTVPAPDAPADPDVTLPPSADTTITNKGTQFAADNDNGAVAAISGTQLTGCDSTCTLPAGEYYLDDIDLGDGDDDTLRFDTSGGDVEVYVDGDVQLSKSDRIENVGPGQVEIYLDDDLQMANKPEVVIEDAPSTAANEEQKAELLWLYMRPSASASLSNQAHFEGVIYGPRQTTAGTGASISLSNKVEIYGAIVGEVSGSSNQVEVHYDLSLTDATALGGGTTVPRVAYLHVSVSEIEAE